MMMMMALVSVLKKGLRVAIQNCSASSTLIYGCLKVCQNCRSLGVCWDCDCDEDDVGGDDVDDDNVAPTCFGDTERPNVAKQVGRVSCRQPTNPLLTQPRLSLVRVGSFFQFTSLIAPPRQTALTLTFFHSIALAGQMSRLPQHKQTTKLCMSVIHLHRCCHNVYLNSFTVHCAQTTKSPRV